MKLKQEQVLYIRSMGKALKVTAIFTETDAANNYMESAAGKEQGVVAVFEPYIFIAHLYDRGVEIKEKSQ